MTKYKDAELAVDEWSSCVKALWQLLWVGLLSSRAF